MKVELERAVAIQGMQQNWILAIMPKYVNSTPGSQKWNFSKNFIFLERPPNFASNEPSTTCRHKGVTSPSLKGSMAP